MVGVQAVALARGEVLCRDEAQPQHAARLALGVGIELELELPDPTPTPTPNPKPNPNTNPNLAVGDLGELELRGVRRAQPSVAAEAGGIDRAHGQQRHADRAARLERSAQVEARAACSVHVRRWRRHPQAVVAQREAPATGRRLRTNRSSGARRRPACSVNGRWRRRRWRGRRW